MTSPGGPDPLVGREGAPFVVPIEQGKVRELARAVKASAPTLVDGASTVPPTFLTVARLWQTEEADPWSGVDRAMSRVLHGEQEFRFHGPPPAAGDRLTARTRIARRYAKRGRRGGTMTFTVLVTEFRDAGGRLVAEAEGTTIETGGSPSAGER